MGIWCDMFGSSFVPTTIIIDGHCCPLSYYPNQAKRLAHIFTTLCGLSLEPVCLIIFCYARIVLLIRKRAAVTVTVGVKNIQPNSEQENKSRRKLNTVKILALTASVFLISWTPLIIIVLLDGFGFIQDMEGDFYLAACLIEFTSYLLNPFLYAWQYDSVRNSIKKLLWKQDNSQTTQQIRY